MNDKRSLASTVSALIGVASRAINQIAAIAVVLVAARFLGPMDFGVFAIASAFVTYVRSTLYAGPYEYLLKTQDPADAAECLSVNIALSLVLTLCLFVLSRISGTLFQSDSVGWLLAILAPSNLLNAFVAWQESQLLRMKRIRVFYAMSAAVEIISAIVTILLLVDGAGLEALAIQIYLRAVLQFLGYTIILRAGFALSIRLPVARRIASWSLSRYGAVSITFIHQYAADIMLGVFLTPAAAGTYRAANRIVTALSDLFAQPAGLFGTTLFSSRAAGGRSSGDLWPQLLTASAFVGWSALAGLAAAANNIVPLLLGPEWMQAALLVPFFCAARAGGILVSATIPLLVAYDRNVPLLFIQIVAAVLVVAALLITAPMGVVPAALTTVAASILTTAAYMTLAVRLHPESHRGLLRAAPLVLIPAIATAFAALLTQTALSDSGVDGLALVSLTVAAGLSVWFAFLFLFRTRIACAFAALSP